MSYLDRSAAISRAARRASSRRWRVENLEQRNLLAAVDLIVQPAVVAPDHAGPKHVQLADIDGDLDLDLLTTSQIDNRIGWYENRDAQGDFGPLNLITETAARAVMSIAVDLDGDDDLDVASVQPGSNRVAWYENLDGRGTFGLEQVVTESAITGSSITAADVDGDGDLDLISSSSEMFDSDVSWYENTDSLGSFGPQQIVTADLEEPLSTAAADLDGDGDLDVLSTSYFNGQVAWFENADRQGTFDDLNLIDDLEIATKAIAADVDGDGDADVVAGNNELPSSVVWYENTGGGNFGPRQDISNTVDGVTTLLALDLDGDNDLDVVSASLYDNQAAWYENTDGEGAFVAPRLLPTNADNLTSLDAGDIDGDGDFDFAYTSYKDDVVAWIENLDGQFGAPQRVTALGVSGVDSMVAVDLDGDADLDLAVAAVLEGTVSWFENTDGRGTYGDRQFVDDSLAGAISIVAADLDGNQHADLLVASAVGDVVTWYANDGRGSFAARAVIGSQVFATESAQAADLDGDGDLDVIAVATGYDEFTAGIQWFENLDGSGTFSDAQQIDSLLERPRELVPVDLDGDDDVDLAVVSWTDNSVVWYENDGTGNFGSEQEVSFEVSVPISVRAGDVDQDGDADLLVAGFGGNRVYWFENIGFGERFEPHALTGQVGPEGIALADLDSDGDLDILSSAVVDDTAAWYENLDGNGTFSDMRLIDDQLAGAGDILAADIDGDQDLDVVVGAYDASRVNWYRNNQQEQADFDADGQLTSIDVDRLCQAIQDRQNPAEFDLTGEGLVNDADFDRMIDDILRTTPGDANLDGVFDPEDLVAIFIVGEYNDDLAGNSNWADGDWNCDHEFNSEDIVAAFDAGGYVTAASIRWSDVAASLTDDYDQRKRKTS